MLSTTIEKAKQLCLNAHKGQVDKGGNPYYLHPFAVSEMCTTETEKIVALLHDVIEDTQTTLTDLQLYGFDETVITAVDVITKRKEESYTEYLKRIKGNEIAKTVKLADLAHNCLLERLSTNITTRDLKRLTKYKDAIIYLNEK